MTRSHIRGGVRQQKARILSWTQGGFVCTCGNSVSVETMVATSSHVVLLQPSTEAHLTGQRRPPPPAGMDCPPPACTTGATFRCRYCEHSTTNFGFQFSLHPATCIIRWQSPRDHQLGATHLCQRVRGPHVGHAIAVAILCLVRLSAEPAPHIGSHLRQSMAGNMVACYLKQRPQSWWPVTFKHLLQSLPLQHAARPCLCACRYAA
jgi:hypothetical protein